MKVTAPTPLTDLFLERVRSPFDAVAGHGYFRGFIEGTIDAARCRKGLLGFYPLVEAFPRYMALTLARVGSHDRPRAEEARSWLMRNIATEERHRDWWVDLGRPLGLKPADFGAARPTAAMDAPNHYLFRVASTGSVAEAVAAVNYAVEGTTGVWTKRVAEAVPAMAGRLGLRVDARATRWLAAHADYDDRHPVEALEIVKVYAADEAEMGRAADAAVRSLEYMRIALDDALREG